MSTIHPGRTGGTPYEEVQASHEFAALRRRFRNFVFPLTAAFLIWYFLYVVLAAFAEDFMSKKLVGNINVGLVFGLLQFVSTFVITGLYARWMDREFDPVAEQMREHIERGEVQ